jgi:putative transcriptional regulator
MMISREALVRDIHATLVKAGFATSDPKNIVHSSFDIVARKESMILIIKVVLNASSVSERAVVGMATLAKAVDGSPVIIASKTGKTRIEDGVMYMRANIPMISPQTLFDLVIEGVPPMVYAASGGLYVKVDSEILREVREGGASLGDLAEVGGVQRRTIQMYEEGMSAKLEVALRLEERLGVELILPVNPLAEQRSAPGYRSAGESKGLAKEVFDDLNRIGYSVDIAPRCPFDAVTHDDDVVLFTGVDKKRADINKRAKAIANLSRILEKHSVIFVDRLGEKVNLEGSPLVGSKELKEIESKKRVIELIEERG